MSLTILLGDYGTGKTTTAKYLVKHKGGVYLDVDSLSQRNDNYDSSTLIEKLKSIIKPGVDYFLDGFPTGYYYGTLTRETLDIPVNYIVCMAAPDTTIKRQIKKEQDVDTTLPRSIGEIKGITHLCASIALTYDRDPLFADTTAYPPIFWKKQAWFIRWMEINIYASLKDAGEYQDVELSDRTVTGLSKSYKTWDRLRSLIDFSGKSVIDYGCNYGYFCFKAEETGASIMIGVDESQSVINMATSIAMTKGSRAKFVTSELKNFKPIQTDIIMALNVLHHLNYDSAVIMRMFKSAGMVVIEMPDKDLPKVDLIARSQKFGAPVIASSHREGRCIVIYSKLQPVTLLNKYHYHPKRTAFKKWLFQMAKKILPQKGLGITRKIKRIISRTRNR